MVNRIELLGNITHVPELRFTPLGVPYCFLRLATHRFSGSQRHTDFHFLTAWHGVAQRAGQHLDVGDRVFVEGRIESYRLDRDGDVQERVRFIATRVIPLHNRPRREDTAIDVEQDVADVSTALPEVHIPVEEAA